MAISITSNLNPIDEFVRKRWGLQRNFKLQLALSNPRPSGILLRSITPIFPLPWERLTNEQFKAEMFKNAELYQVILLRHSRINMDNEFLDLFDESEKEFKAAIKRAKWYLLTSTSSGKETLMGRLERSLELLDEHFSVWATNHRETVYPTLLEIMNDSSRHKGNAVTELSVASPTWFQKDS